MTESDAPDGTKIVSLDELARDANTVLEFILCTHREEKLYRKWLLRQRRRARKMRRGWA